METSYTFHTTLDSSTKIFWGVTVTDSVLIFSGLHLKYMFGSVHAEHF
jgi:hypothetical protein